MYEDYLLDELRAILNSFRAYVDGLQNRVNSEDENSLNSKQQEAIEKNTELELKRDNGSVDMEYRDVENKVRKLVLKNPNVSDNAANASIVQVIAFVVGIAIILTAVTLYLLG